ncbi:hypothetical protein CerSpe_240690 [Prunus speciosa]
MMGRRMKGIPSPGTPDQKNMKCRKAEKQRISALEANVELLLDSAGAMQDINKTPQDRNERLEEQHIGLQANLRRTQRKILRDSCRTRRVERRLFGEESASFQAPQTSEPPSLEDVGMEATFPAEQSQHEVDAPTATTSETDLRATMKAMIKGEMGSVWDRLGKVKKTQTSQIPPFSKDELPLPYSKELLDSVVIGYMKAPKIALYEGLTDPYDHLDSFRYAMEGRGANEATKYRLFPTTLKGAALNWFKRLNPTSINSFAELRRAFLDRYMIISSRLYTANDLSAVRQMLNESLRDDITHFNNEYSRCEGCDEATAHNALMGGLQGGTFPSTSLEIRLRRTRTSSERPRATAGPNSSTRPELACRAGRIQGPTPPIRART